MDTDPRIYSCLIVRDPSGAALAEVTRPEMRDNLGSLTERSGGMVGQWGILAYKALSRLDGVRTKAKYIVVGREKFNGLIFPIESDRDILLGITFDAETNPREIFAKLREIIEESTKVVGK
jgi:hypothetical protein